jgi:hypothetical protein
MSAAMGLADIYRRAADLIEPEGAWTKGSYARDEHGKQVFFRDSNAVCFCAIGALTRIDPLHSCNSTQGFEGFLDVPSLAGWNDAPERTQAEVVAAFRAAADAQVSA